MDDFFSWDGFTSFVGGVVNSISEGLGGIDNALGQLFDSFDGDFESDSGSFTEGLGDFFGSAADKLFGSAERVEKTTTNQDGSATTNYSESKGLINGALGWIQKNDKAASLIGNVALGVNSAYQKAKDREAQQELLDQRLQGERQLLKDRYDLDVTKKREMQKDAFNFGGR